MDFLRMLETIRTPFLDTFMSLITHFGDELLFMVLAITVFWCVSKRDGYYILCVGFLGTVCNQFLKLWFRVPRPWVLDPDFTIVESARAAATGYSFPSGHTQNVVGTMSCFLLTSKQKAIRYAAFVLLILVPFSRMYLGVHTPKDVLVSVALALILACSLRPIMRKSDHNPNILPALLAAMLGICALYWCFVTFYKFPVNVDPHNLASGTKNAYTLLGCVLGMIVVTFLDRRYIHFEVDAVWWAQILKVVLGLAGLLLIKEGLRAPLELVLPVYPARAVRYFFVVFFAGSVWPLTFPKFAKLGRKPL